MLSMLKHAPLLAVLCLVQGLNMQKRTSNTILAKEEPPRKIVFDIGMNRGDDTARYLKMGFDVVAVEANPAYSKKNEELFKKDIESGRVTLLNNAVADRAGETVTFYVPTVTGFMSGLAGFLDWTGVTKGTSFDASASEFLNEKKGMVTVTEHLDESASMDKDQACKTLMKCGEGLSRAVCSCNEVNVTTTTYGAMVEKHGVPYFLKVDIEGGDAKVIDEVAKAPCSSLPSFLSFEEQDVHGGSSNDLIMKLKAKGYTSWKVTRHPLADHFSIGAGPFGDDAEDYETGKEWSDFKEATKKATKACWDKMVKDKDGKEVKETQDCDVHAKLDPSACTE